MKENRLALVLSVLSMFASCVDAKDIGSEKDTYVETIYKSDFRKENKKVWPWVVTPIGILGSVLVSVLAHKKLSGKSKKKLNNSYNLISAMKNSLPKVETLTNDNNIELPLLGPQELIKSVTDDSNSLPNVQIPISDNTNKSVDTPPSLSNIQTLTSDNTNKSVDTQSSLSDVQTPLVNTGSSLSNIQTPTIDSTNKSVNIESSSSNVQTPTGNIVNDNFIILNKIVVNEKGNTSGENKPDPAFVEITDSNNKIIDKETKIKDSKEEEKSLELTEKEQSEIRGALNDDIIMRIYNCEPDTNNEHQWGAMLKVMKLICGDHSNWNEYNGSDPIVRMSNKNWENNIKKDRCRDLVLNQVFSRIGYRRGLTVLCWCSAKYDTENFFVVYIDNEGLIRCEPYKLVFKVPETIEKVKKCNNIHGAINLENVSVDLNYIVLKEGKK